MTDLRRREARRVFIEVAGLPAAMRSAAIAEACGGDAVLRAEVEALIHARAGASAAEPRPDAEPTLDTLDTLDTSANASSAAPHEHVGQMMGRYKLLEQIGEGGFGVVWAAEQREPVKRRVALKIIKLGMDTRQVIARFEAERQALAMMDHPNIATVLDAGSTETGRPYFVMELVKGMPILEYCDTQRLDTTRRLELFIQVCNAIQHAHHKGIIHRDIKPSNVMITLHDGTPVPKVIDFGIAKATNQELTSRTIYTEHRQMIGTPAYMSPEQAEMSGLDIDTRSDIYSLGVLLYELLTGTTPFDSGALLAAGIAEMMRIIREEEPHKPSTRLSSLGDTATRTAERRRVDVKRLGLVLRGDLDWIVMKCLEKDRVRRYETANSLAMDIRRHLTDEPVLAGPPSTRYRMGKFIRRNRGQVVAGGIVAVLLVSALTTFALLSQWAMSEWDRAESLLMERDSALEAETTAKLEAQENEQRAIAEAARASAMNAFMQHILTAANPFVSGRGNDVTVREVLADASRIAGERLGDEPLVEAEARTFLGSTLVSLGQVEEGVAELDRAISIREAEGEGRSGAQMGTYRALGAAAASRQDFQQAQEAFLSAREIGEAYRDSMPVETVTIGIDLARANINLSRYDAAAELLDEAEALYEQSGLNRPGLLAYVANMRSQIATGRDDDADRALHYTEMEIAYRRLDGNQIELQHALNNLAVLKMTRGSLDEAETLFREVIELSRATHGTMNQNTATFLENLANVQFRRQDYGQAFQTLAEVSEIRDTVLGPESLAAARTRSNTASVAVRVGEYERAVELVEGVEPIFRAELGPGSASYAVILKTKADALEGLGDLDAALAARREVLAIRSALWPATDRRVLGTKGRLIGLLCRMGRQTEAETLLEASLAELDAGDAGQAEAIAELRSAYGACTGSGGGG